MPRDRDAGFTLLEVLVAFLIAAAALAVLFRAAGESASSVAVASRYTEALSRARSHLAEADALIVAPGDREGDDGGGYLYRVRITPRQAGAGLAGVLTPALFDVSVAISWDSDGRPRAVQLDTQRLGIAPPRAP